MKVVLVVWGILDDLDMGLMIFNGFMKWFGWEWNQVWMRGEIKSNLIMSVMLMVTWIKKIKYLKCSNLNQRLVIRIK